MAGASSSSPAAADTQVRRQTIHNKVEPPSSSSAKGPLAVPWRAPIALLAVSAFVGLGEGTPNVLFVVAVLVVAALMGRALVLYRRSRSTRSSWTPTNAGRPSPGGDVRTRLVWRR